MKPIREVQPMPKIKDILKEENPGVKLVKHGDLKYMWPHGEEWAQVQETNLSGRLDMMRKKP